MPGKTRTRPGFPLAGAALLVLGVSLWIQWDVSPAPPTTDGRVALATDPAARAVAPTPRASAPAEAVPAPRSDEPAAAHHDPPYRWIEELARIEALFAEAPTEAETRLAAFLERSEVLPPGSSLRAHALGMRLVVALGRDEEPEAARAHLEALAAELDRLAGEPVSEVERLSLWERLDPALESIGEELGAEAAERLLESARDAGAILPVSQWVSAIVLAVAERYRAEGRPAAAERYLDRALDAWERDHLDRDDRAPFEQRRDRMLSSLDLLAPSDPRRGVVLTEVALTALEKDAPPTALDAAVDHLLQALESRHEPSPSTEMLWLLDELVRGLEPDRSRQAEAVLRAAAERLGSSSDAASFSSISTQMTLAHLLLDRGSGEEALEIFTRIAPTVSTWADAPLLPESHAMAIEEAAGVYRHAADTTRMLELLDELAERDVAELTGTLDAVSAALEEVARGLAEAGFGPESRAAVDRAIALRCAGTDLSTGTEGPSRAEENAALEIESLAAVLDELREPSEADALRRRAEALRSADPAERARALDPDEPF